MASRDAKTLYVALADSRKVACVDLPDGKVVRQLDMPAEPTGLALTPDEKRLIVTCAAPKSTVVVLDLVSARTAAAIPTGHTAAAPAISPDGKRLYVCNRFDNNVSVIDLATYGEMARVKVVREPVATAVTPDGKSVLVANHLPNDRADAYPLSAAVSIIDAQTHATTSVALPHGSHSLRGLCVSPDGKYAYLTHLTSNFELTPTQLDMGWMSNNVISVIDIEEERLLRTIALDETYQGSANPWGIACTGDGKLLCVTHAGSHELSIIRTAAIPDATVRKFIAASVTSLPEDPPGGSPLRRVELPGKGPRAVAVAGGKAYIAEYFSDTLAVADLQAEIPARSIALGKKPPFSARRRGELLFNDATICYQRWQSCASCHPDGRTDVLNWDLMNDGVGNPKNTKSMVLAWETPPSMAEGIRESAKEAVRSGIGNILFAQRPEEEAQAIGEYLKSLKPVPSPHLVDGKLSPAAERGKKLFASDRTGCSKCHPAPTYTDQKMHNLGTRGPRDFVDRFDTPTLVEIWRTAPYLHDGTCLTIKEVIEKGKRHGHIAGLSQQEIDDLVEFVLSL